MSAQHLAARLQLIRESFNASARAEKLKGLGIRIDAGEGEHSSETDTASTDSATKPNTIPTEPSQAWPPTEVSTNPDIIEAVVVEVKNAVESAVGKAS